jgi:hypothetical protein
MSVDERARRVINSETVATARDGGKAGPRDPSAKCLAPDAATETCRP